MIYAGKYIIEFLHEISSVIIVLKFHTTVNLDGSRLPVSVPQGVSLRPLLRFVLRVFFTIIIYLISRSSIINEFIAFSTCVFSY